MENGYYLIASAVAIIALYKWLAMHLSDAFTIEWIEQWSQFLEDCNWRTFNVVQAELEDDRMFGAVEMTLVLAGIGFRARWTYAETETTRELRRRVEEIEGDAAIRGDGNGEG